VKKKVKKKRSQPKHPHQKVPQSSSYKFRRGNWWLITEIKMQYHSRKEAYIFKLTIETPRPVKHPTLQKVLAMVWVVNSDRQMKPSRAKRQEIGPEKPMATKQTSVWEISKNLMKELKEPNSKQSAQKKTYAQAKEKPGGWVSGRVPQSTIKKKTRTLEKEIPS